MAFRTIDYRVKGKVQGVFFRVFARSTAQRLGVVGWVKNEAVSQVLSMHDIREIVYAHYIIYVPRLTVGRRYWHSAGPRGGFGKIVRATFTCTAILTAEGPRIQQRGPENGARACSGDGRRVRQRGTAGEAAVSGV